MSSGHIQESFSSAVAFTTSGSQVPFTGLPGGIAHALFITANVSGLQVTTVDGTLINFANGAVISTIVPLRCRSWQAAGGSFVGLQ